MAEIPVERKEKSAFPAWLIPLLLLLLLLPLFYYMCGRSDTAAVVGNANGNNNANRGAATTSGANNMNGGAIGAANGGTMANGGNTAVVVNSGSGSMNNGAMNGAGGSGAMNSGGNSGGAAITDVNVFGTTSDKATLVGRGINLSGVRVNRVLSDKVFTVKSGAGELFVMLDDNLDSAGNKEKQIRIKPGQNVVLGGTFRGVPTGEIKEENKEGGLNSKEYAQMKGQQVYLHATSVSDAK